MTVPLRAFSLTIILAALAAACATGGVVDERAAADRIRDRTGARPQIDGPRSSLLPPDVSVDDGLSRDEAVAVALWNNADFLVSVSELPLGSL